MADDKDATEPPTTPEPPPDPPDPPPPSDDFGMHIRGGGGWLYKKDSSRDPEDQ